LACPNEKHKEAHVPFLFWLPMIFMSGLFSVAVDGTRPGQAPHED
jgi:hypothetical protein